MKVKSESEVAQSCPTHSDPMDCRPPGSSVHGIFQARVLEWVPLPSPTCLCRRCKRCGFDPGVSKIPWSRTWQPTPVFLPGKSHGWTVHGITKSQTWLSNWAHTQSSSYGFFYVKCVFSFLSNIQSLPKGFLLCPLFAQASLVAQRLKRLPARWETWVQSLGQEDALEREMATHSSIPARRIPWREEPGGLQSTGSQRVGHDWSTSLTHSLVC